MAVRIYISHSVAPRELAIVNSVADAAASNGAVPIIPHRDWGPESTLPERIRSQIDSSDFVIAIVTRNGRQLDWVNSETGYGMAAKKPTLVLADQDVTTPPELGAIRIDRTDPLGSISLVSAEIQKMATDKTMKYLVGGVAIGGLVLLLLASVKGE